LPGNYKNHGFLFREARRVVNAIVDLMIEALQGGGTVEFPKWLGRFQVVDRPPPLQLTRSLSISARSHDRRPIEGSPGQCGHF
jgi:hypothetical protein